MKKQSLLIAVMITLLAANVVRAAAPDSDGQEYIVQPGDWLSRIAGKFYGDILAYPSIVKATNAKAAEDDSFDVIDNPDVIEIDQKLWIPAQAPEPGGVTLMDLKNGVYEGIYAEPVQLADGKFEGEPFVEGGASRPTVTFVNHAFGDLNGDGATDAAVALVENSGGSGVFWYLAAMINQDGKPVNVATHFLGDRWQVQSMVITDGEIVLDAVTHGPEDPMCCPSVEKSLTFVFQDGQWVETTPATED